MRLYLCGNPAVVEACASLDRWLCVPAFRRVCPCHETKCRRMATMRQAAQRRLHKPLYISWRALVTPVACCTCIPPREPRRRDLHAPYARTGTWCVHEFTRADIHTDVIYTAAAEAEKHEIACTQILVRNVRAFCKLCRSGARNADAATSVNRAGEPRTIEAAFAIITAVAIGATHFDCRELRDLPAREGFALRGLRGAATEQQHQ
jgi:hypothetical protein